jgi:probable rRNA maturation factor
MKKESHAARIVVLGTRDLGLKARVVKLTRKLFGHFSATPCLKKRKSKSTEHVDLSVVFVTEVTSKRLNRIFRKKNYPTDVLSFSTAENGVGLGEIVVCPKVLQRQARDQGHSYRKELDYMVIHGFLHLIGYDHEKNKREELKMMTLQDKLFKKLSR